MTSLAPGDYDGLLASVTKPFHASRPTQLSLSPGQEVNVLEVCTSKWWIAELNGAVGIVPAESLRVKIPGRLTQSRPPPSHLSAPHLSAPASFVTPGDHKPAGTAFPPPPAAAVAAPAGGGAFPPPPPAAPVAAGGGGAFPPPPPPVSGGAAFPPPPAAGDFPPPPPSGGITVPPPEPDAQPPPADLPPPSASSGGGGGSGKKGKKGKQKSTGASPAGPVGAGRRILPPVLSGKEKKRLKDLLVWSNVTGQEPLKHEGPLSVRGGKGGKKSGKEFYGVLYGNIMAWYKGSKGSKPKTNESPAGYLDISRVNSGADIQQRTDLSPHAFSVTTDESVGYFETQEDRHREAWLRELAAQVQFFADCGISFDTVDVKVAECAAVFSEENLAERAPSAPPKWETAPEFVENQLKLMEEQQEWERYLKAVSCFAQFYHGETKRMIVLFSSRIKPAIARSGQGAIDKWQHDLMRIVPQVEAVVSRDHLGRYDKEDWMKMCRDGTNLIDAINKYRTQVQGHSDNILDRERGLLTAYADRINAIPVVD